MSVSRTGTVVLRGGRVIDVAGTDAIADVLIRDGMIAEVGTDLAAPKGAIVLDAEGAIVSSGLVDIQVHFREPGGEDAETIRSGSRAAADQSGRRLAESGSRQARRRPVSRP